MAEKTSNLDLDSLRDEICDRVKVFSEKVISASGDNLQNITIVGSSLTEDFRPVTGFIGQAAFFSRFVIQWVISEKQKKSVIPPCFWYLSIFGSTILLIYAIVRKDPVFIVAFLFNNVVCIRNMMPMFRHRSQKEA